MKELSVSIGICAYNEERNIGRLLSFLQKEKFRFNVIEIIVVASGCTDRTVDIVREFTKVDKRINLIVEKKRKGKASAINIILRKAKGDLLVFIGGDNLPAKGSVDKVIKPLLNKDVGASSGRPIPLNSNGIKGKIEGTIWLLHHKICEKFPKISGELCAIKTYLVRRIPPNIINDDSYITALILRNGLKIKYVPNAVTYMVEKSKTLISHLKRRRRIARGYIQLKEIGMNYSIPLSLVFFSLVELIKEKHVKFSIVLLAIILEIIANFIAFIDTIVGYTPFRW